MDSKRSEPNKEGSDLREDLLKAVSALDLLGAATPLLRACCSLATTGPSAELKDRLEHFENECEFFSRIQRRISFEKQIEALKICLPEIIEEQRKAEKLLLDHGIGFNPEKRLFEEIRPEGQRGQKKRGIALIIEEICEAESNRNRNEHEQEKYYQLTVFNALSIVLPDSEGLYSRRFIRDTIHNWFNRTRRTRRTKPSRSKSKKNRKKV
jgi:hypothetical protein